jgi:hypothetical protein
MEPKSILEASTEALDESAVATWEGPERMKLWALPSTWHDHFILRTGAGIHTVFVAFTRGEARDWLDRNGYPDIELPVRAVRPPEWSADASGLQHWRSHVGVDKTVEAAATRCLAAFQLPRVVPLHPAWFWWAGTPAPIVPGDTVSSLVERWNEWWPAWSDSSYGGGLADMVTKWIANQSRSYPTKP